MSSQVKKTTPQLLEDEAILEEDDLKSFNLYNSIAAVDIDGNTTLKRFVSMVDTILLMPENPDYEPINVGESQMNILGVAVGVVKSI